MALIEQYTLGNTKIEIYDDCMVSEEEQKKIKARLTEICWAIVEENIREGREI